MKINSETLALKYITQLEKDLVIERKRLEQMRADLDFYRGKCERLELSIMNSSSAPAASDFVRRTDPRKPSVGAARLQTSMKPMFSELREKWNKMSAEDQNKAVEQGSWDVQTESEAAK